VGTAGIAGASTTSNTTNTPAATSDGVCHLSGIRPAATGTVKTVGADTFTLTTRHGTVVTVDVSGTTTWLDRGVTSPNLHDVTVGSHVTVAGTAISNTITATKVHIGAKRAGLVRPNQGEAWQNHSPSAGPPAAA
jgi:hypothetical protein